MKIIFVYFMLIVLTFSMILAVDLIAGMNLRMEFQSMHSIYATTTLQEYIFMIVFSLLPFIVSFKNFLNKNSHNK